MHHSWILERQTETKNDQSITANDLQNYNRIILDNNVDTYSIGRARENTINCISIYVSRRHCYIKRKDDKMYIVDLGSANGTFVNNTQILPRREIPLVAGDIIGLGISEYLSKECFVYKLSKEPKDDQPSCIVLSDSEEECIPQVEKEIFPKFSRKRLLVSSDPVPHKVPRLSHFEVKQEHNGISDIPSAPFSTLNCGVACLESTVLSRSLVSEPQIHIKTECLIDQESCTNNPSVKCETEASHNRVFDIKSQISSFHNGVSISDCSNPSSLSAVHLRNNYSTEENSSSMKSVKSELNISEKNICAENVIHEYQPEKHKSTVVDVCGNEKIKVEEKLSILDSESTGVILELINHEYQAKKDEPTVVGVHDNEKIKVEAKLNIPNSGPKGVIRELINHEYQAEKHEPIVVGVNPNENIKVEMKLNISNSAPIDVFNKLNNLVSHECQSEKLKSSPVVVCANEKIKVEEKLNIPDSGSIGELNNFTGTVNNLVSNDIPLKELRIKLERIDNNIVPELQSSICNYTLEDDIIVISDDEELFPCSQIFDEELVKVKEEIKIENPYSEKSSTEINDHVALVCIDDDNIIDDNGEIQNFEAVDSDDSDDNEWLTKLSQTYFNDDMKSGGGNNLNPASTYAKKQDDIENSCSIESQDESQLIVPRHKKVKPILMSDDEDSNFPSFDQPKKIISSKPILIEAPHLKKPKRSVKTVTSKRPSKTDKNVSQSLPKVSKKQPKVAILERVLRKITNGPACVKDNSSTGTSSHRRSSSEQKSNITEERKKRLKAIAEHGKTNEKTDTKAKRPTHCTKLTEKTRGEYLVESMKPTEIVQRSKVDIVADTSKKSDRNTDAKRIQLLDKKSETCRSKSISDLPKIPRIKNSDSSIGANLDSVSPLQCSPVNVHGSYSKETITKPSSTCSNSVISSANFADSYKAPKPLSSCLKKVTISDKIKNSKNVSFDTVNLTSVKTYDIPAGSKLIPLGSIKDAPIPKSVAAGCISNSQVNKFLNEIIGLICQWNPRWLEEQKNKKEPPPLLNMKLYPMLTSFSSYEDYKTILIPLMIHNLWKIISSDMETSPLSRFPALIFHLEKCDTYNSNSMRIKCSAVMGPKDTTTTYPKLGDLVIAEIQLNPTSLPKANSGGSQETLGSRLFAHCFAYVERSNMERCRLDNFNNKFCSSFPPSTTKLSLNLCVKSNDYKSDTPIRIKVLKYIRSDLRQFQGLAALQTSSLCDLILKPSYSTYSLPKAGRDVLWTKDTLNYEQKKAILECAAACIKNDPKICLIQGPPGTGKSTVIKNLVMQILYGRNDYIKNKRRRNSKCPRILLCTPSNAGIDELVEKLLAVRQYLPKDLRFKMVRVGNTQNMRGMAKDISLQELAKKEVRSTAENFQNDPESLELEFRCIEAKRKCYLTNLESSSSLNEISRIAIQSKILSLDFKKKQLEQSKNQVAKSNDQKLAEERTAQTAILQGADIVATTLNSCFTNLMETIFGPNSTSHTKFTCCIIDEATQCSEPESLIPLLHCINTLVLVGDTEQLPATVISNEAKKLGLGQSLFSRIQNCFVGQQTPVHMLTMQYRMHPEICLWPNLYFYMGKLQSGPDLAEKRKSSLLPYVIISLDSLQDSFGELKNSREAEFVKKLALSIAETNSWMRISIITPYNKQRQEIVHLLNDSNHKFGSRIEVNTIDSSQGQEREVVIMSCTRTDGVGFLTNTERLNVALTRARYSLILCGNFRSLLKSFSGFHPGQIVEIVRRFDDCMHCRHLLPEDDDSAYSRRNVERLPQFDPGGNPRTNSTSITPGKPSFTDLFFK